MKKKLAIFVCSNGLGHFSRVLKITKYLTSVYDVDIYCEKFQYEKFNPNSNAKSFKKLAFVPSMSDARPPKKRTPG